MTADFVKKKLREMGYDVRFCSIIKRSMGSEDFAYVANEVPSVFLGIAAGRPEDGTASSNGKISRRCTSGGSRSLCTCGNGVVEEQ